MPAGLDSVDAEIIHHPPDKSSAPSARSGMRPPWGDDVASLCTVRLARRQRCHLDDPRYPRRCITACPQLAGASRDSCPARWDKGAMFRTDHPGLWCLARLDAWAHPAHRPISINSDTTPALPGDALSARPSY